MLKSKELHIPFHPFHTHTPKGYVWNEGSVESNAVSGGPTEPAHEHCWGAWTTMLDEAQGVYKLWRKCYGCGHEEII